MKAINAYNYNLPLIDAEIVQNTINNSDVEKAEYLIEKYNLV
jgi:hypothetical protein